MTMKALLPLTLAIAFTAAASPIHFDTTITQGQHDSTIYGGGGPDTFVYSFLGAPWGTPYSGFNLDYTPPNWDLSADLDFGGGNPPPYFPQVDPPDKGGPHYDSGYGPDPYGAGPPAYPLLDCYTPPPPCDLPPPDGPPPSTVPEAGTSGMLLIGVGGLLWLRQRRRQDEVGGA